MSARLYCKTGDLNGAEFVIGDEAVIGRDRDLDITLHPKMISGTHAKIYFDKSLGAYFLEDLRSRNGTKLDGMEVDVPTKLGSLHVITFADHFDFVFQVLPELRHILLEHEDVKPEERIDADINVISESTPPEPDGEQSEKTKHTDDFGYLPEFSEPKFDQQSVEPVPATDVFILAVESLDGDEKIYTLTEGEYIVGRKPECEIHLDDPSVSRKHALLSIQSDKITLKDMGSKNFTYVDGERIAAEVEIEAGSILAFGPQFEGLLTVKKVK